MLKVKYNVGLSEVSTYPVSYTYVHHNGRELTLEIVCKDMRVRNFNVLL